MYAWVLSIQKYVKNILIGVSKLRSAYLSLCGPVMDSRPVQGVSCLSPNGIGSNPPATQNLIKRFRKWMDGLKEK